MDGWMDGWIGDCRMGGGSVEGCMLLPVLTCVQCQCVLRMKRIVGGRAGKRSLAARRRCVSEKGRLSHGRNRGSRTQGTRRRGKRKS